MTSETNSVGVIDEYIRFLKRPTTRMPKPIRVLHVFSRLNRGGAETRTLELVRHIDRDQYRADFCVLSDRPGELDDEARALRSDVYSLGLRRWGFSSRFRRLLQQGCFDVVHSHVHLASGLLLRLAAQCNVPVRIVHFRSTDDGRSDNPIRTAYRHLMRHWIDRHATHILAVSQWAMTRAWKRDWQSDTRCQVVYNGLDLSRFMPHQASITVRHEFLIREHVPLYLHVGRMTEAKNHLRLIDIFATIRKYQTDARLLLVGSRDKRLEEHVRQRIAAHALDNAVVCTGERTDVPRFLDATDAMIFPSLWEGLPGAVLEACVAGTPVVATDLPCIGEIAAQFPAVHRLPLAANNEEWATAVLRAAREKPPKEQALQRFAQSSFTLRQCLRSTCQIWDTSQRTARRAA